MTPDITEARRLADLLLGGAAGPIANCSAAVMLRFMAAELERLRHWQQIANERSVEIHRLSDELERLRALSAELRNERARWPAELRIPLRVLVAETAEHRRIEAAMKHPPCTECGAMTAEEASTRCIYAGDKDDCHGCSLWPD